jgi:hypothetical protein
MKFMTWAAGFIPFFLLFFFIFEPKVCAYLDPGTGSYILQLLIAGFASAILALKIFWKKLASVFKRIRGKNENDEQNRPLQK